MFRSPRLRIVMSLAVAVLLTTLITSTAQAKSRLLTMADGVVAYSGPGDYYRILAIFPARTELTAASVPIRSKNGSFYKVVVKLSEKKSVIGYISTEAMATFISDKLDEDDLTKYGDVALVSRAIQFSYSGFRDQASLATIGYMKYLSPGFYVKGFGGKFSNPQSGAIVAGGEVGNDAILVSRVSGFVSYDIGVFVPNSSGQIFDASSAVNAMMQASFGARYNLGGIVSLSAAGTQAVFFNANNSLVTSGGTVTFEVGL